MKKILSFSWYSRFLTTKYEEVSCTDTPPTELRWAFPAPGNHPWIILDHKSKILGFTHPEIQHFFALDIRCHLMVSSASYNQDNLSNRQNSADASHSNFRHNAAEQKWNLNLHFYSTRKCLRYTISAKKASNAFHREKAYAVQLQCWGGTSLGLSLLAFHLF